MKALINIEEQIYFSIMLIESAKNLQFCSCNTPKTEQLRIISCFIILERLDNKMSFKEISFIFSSISKYIYF